MSVGKYSPTVSHSYRVDQEWFRKNGGDFDNGNNHNSQYDNDGFDSYGYAANCLDRSGHTENEYLTTSDEDGYYLADRVYNEWGATFLLTDTWPLDCNQSVKNATKIIDGGETDIALLDLLPTDVRREIERFFHTTFGDSIRSLSTEKRAWVALAKAWAIGQRGL
jgi:hypothetical protein